MGGWLQNNIESQDPLIRQMAAAYMTQAEGSAAAGTPMGRERAMNSLWWNTQPQQPVVNGNPNNFFNGAGLIGAGSNGPSFGAGISGGDAGNQQYQRSSNNAPQQHSPMDLQALLHRMMLGSKMQGLRNYLSPQQG